MVRHPTGKYRRTRLFVLTLGYSRKSVRFLVWRSSSRVWAVKQGEAGLATAELWRQHGLTEQTYYRWKAKYAGMESGDARKLKQLEEENRKLKFSRWITTWRHKGSALLLPAG
jgi:Transposase